MMLVHMAGDHRFDAAVVNQKLMQPIMIVDLLTVEPGRVNLDR